MNTVRKNLDAHSPFTVAPYCDVSMRGFVFCASEGRSDVYNHFTRRLFSRRNARQ